jgi:indolepyruvate ferredoxin oxidoreductase beta subunit
MPCITGAAKYPETLKEEITSSVKNAKFVNAKAVAMEAGSEKATNIVMLGCICKLYGFDKAVMEAAVSACVPERFKQLNLTAFRLGYERV